MRKFIVIGNKIINSEMIQHIKLDPDPREPKIPVGQCVNISIRHQHHLGTEVARLPVSYYCDLEETMKAIFKDNKDVVELAECVKTKSVVEKYRRVQFVERRREER